MLEGCQFETPTFRVIILGKSQPHSAATATTQKRWSRDCLNMAISANED
jgi:hypothetical protein